MDRGWYVRFLFVFSLAACAWLVVWPSLDPWLPAPASVKEYFPGRISPGLDIRGGLRLMYEVEVEEAVRDRRDLRADQFLRVMGERLKVIAEGENPTREQLAETREKVAISSVEDRKFALKFKNPGDAAKIDHDLIKQYGDLKEISRAGGEVVLEVKGDLLEQIRDTAVQQARETIANRIDALGLKEASVTAQGTDIVVEVPGADEAAFARIRDLVSKTARLEFKIVADDNSFVQELAELPEGITRQSEIVSAGEQAPQVSSAFLVARGPESRQKLADYLDQLKADGKVPAEHVLTLGRLDGGDEETDAPAVQGEAAWRSYLLHARAEVTGQAIEDAFVSNDPQTGKPYVAVNFNREGADLFKDLTGRNVKRRMAIVLDDRVESAPVIQTEIGGGRCQITLGGYRAYNQVLNEANDLVVVLKAGALPVPIRPANEQMIGPTLGRDGIEQGVKGGIVGVALVLLFMLLYYQVAGLVADFAVFLNLLFMLAVLAGFEATLTLPGIAAMALNIGMALDANVLITERIREELRAGKSARAAVDAGYDRAFWSIVDSQLTTFIAGVVMFQYGTGPIKGFAVTLMIGICTSLFTGVFCSRVGFDWLVRGLRVQRLRVG
jgi:preprotein translocase subunit SecD